MRFLSKHFLFPLLFALCFFHVGEASALDYTVFSNGRTGYSIIVSSTASESEKFAASELKSYLDSIGRVNIPIVNNGRGRKGKRIIIGYNSDSKALFPKMREPTPEDDGFTYKSKDGDIIIIGGKDRGTMYGVFSFLENELGCRWFAEDCTIIPRRLKYTFSQLDHSEFPVFSKRSMLFSECKDEVFRLHCRLNERIVTSPKKPARQTGGSYSFLSPHTVKFLLPTEKYYKKHPEYYALINGKRQKEKTQLCYTNPEVQRICLDELRSIMRAYPDIDIYEISGLDNWKECECSNCTRKKKRLGNYSDVVLSFVNSLAASIKKEFPRKRIEYLAYQNTLPIPKTVRPYSNVVIRVCAAGVCHTHGLNNCSTEKSNQLKRELNGWSRIASELYYWEYASSFSWYKIPYPNLRAIQAYFKYLNQLRFAGIFAEGNHYTKNGDFDALKIYVISKLLWNPYCDLDKVINEFLEGYYEKSAPAIKEYINLVYSHIGNNTHLLPIVNHKDSYYNGELVKKGLDLFKKAKQQANNKVILKRVESEELSLKVISCLIAPKSDANKKTAKKILDAVQREEIKIGRQDEMTIFQRIAN